MVGVGLLLGAAVLFRRYFAYAVVVFYLAMAVVTGLYRWRNGATPLNELQLIKPAFVGYVLRFAGAAAPATAAGPCRLDIDRLTVVENNAS